MALGFWVAAVRVRDALAWLLLLLLLSLAEFGGGSWRPLGRTDWFQLVATTYESLLSMLWPTSMLLFGIYFPERLPFDRRRPWAKWIVLGPLLAAAALTGALLIVILNDLRAAIPFDRLLSPAEPVITALYFLAIGLFFAAIAYKASTERQPDARRRLRLLWAGAFVALTPLCIFFLLAIPGVIQFAEWMILPLVGVLFIFPATMAYVIVVQRAMDVRLVIRQGMQYLLARGTVRVIQIVLSAAVSTALAVWAIGQSQVPIEIRVVLVVLGIGTIVLIGRFAERLRGWVDRRFFREAYQAEQILAELANKVRTMVDARPLLETVAHQIASALHVPRIAILLNGGRTLEPAYAVGYQNVRAVPLPDPPVLTPEHEREIREALEAELVLPLSANQKLIGVMGLGPKRSEEPFSSADIRLLDAVATQTGLALENSRLTAEIAAEIAAREKAKRELEIAREVQERLFPQEYPPVAGIEYAGACRPALGVGGDYYDFIPISETGLGLAIGDVSGKGIPAALLMATLRAYLRGQTINGMSNLAAMVKNLNQLVYESSAANRYATFFYAEYDVATRVIRYVNAGHNPPMVFRPSGEIARLDVGGPVIGLMQDCQYEQGCLTLQHGDVLVAFTDGVSEAMDGAMQEFGEERLAATIEPARTLASTQLIDRIMIAADEYVAGAPQHDDMSLVVLRCV
jgi:sigma-B regulation protein RsbU (phosphoserine phosphatase)